MDSMELHRALRAHCQEEKADCTKCCLHLFCYTPPCEMTDGMMEDVISFAASRHSHTESQTHLCHCSDGRSMPCPCELDMSTALGYEHRLKSGLPDTAASYSKLMVASNGRQSAVLLDGVMIGVGVDGIRLDAKAGASKLSITGIDVERFHAGNEADFERFCDGLSGDELGGE